MKKILTSVYSGKGDVRNENQDSVLCRTGKFGNHTAGMFIVADGCGGMANGKQLSSLVTACFGRLWNDTLPKVLSHHRVKKADIEEMLNNELENINKEAISFCRQTGGNGGTTVSLLFMADARYYIKNIGDSRIYRVRHGIKQLTRDQTVAADMLRNGEITAKEALQHKKRHVLSMCIGYFEKLKPFGASGLIHRHDNYIVCCDGLYNCLSDKSIKWFLKHRKSKKFDAAAEEMRNMIEQGQARDNVSVILIRCKGCYW